MGTKVSEPWAGFRGLLAEVERKSPLFTLSFHPVAFSQSASPSPHVPVFSVTFILLSSYLEAVTLLPPPPLSDRKIPEIDFVSNSQLIFLT